jgi:acyl-CoA-binding protein
MVNKIWKAYTKNDWIDLIGIIEYTWDKWEEVKDLTPNQIAEKYIEDWQ